jgi:hypothetical protein
MNQCKKMGISNLDGKNERHCNLVFEWHPINEWKYQLIMAGKIEKELKTSYWMELFIYSSRA